MTDEQICALLRLKRDQQPPEGYLDQLLRDVHRRQREELLHQPLWKIAVERLQTFFGEHSMSPLSYAGAMAGVVVAGVISIGTLTSHRGSAELGASLAANTAPVSAANPRFTLQPEPTLGAFAARGSAALPTVASHTPRYVIDARPVSYDASFSF